MRIGPITTMLLCCTCLTTHALGQNDYDVPAGGGSFTDNNWTSGGPGSWPNGTAVDGAIQFDTTGESGDIVINGIDADYTGLSGLSTTNSANPLQLILEGTGSLSFYNGGDTIVINPSVGLTLRVATFFNGNVHLDTSGMDPAGGLDPEQLIVDSTMSISGDSLLITGENGVVFTEDSVLTMNGTINVGEDNASSFLRVENAGTLNGDLKLQINNTDSVVEFGGNADFEQDFVLGGLSGNGRIVTQRGTGADDDSNLIINGNFEGDRSIFNGNMLIEGDLVVTGQGTRFEYAQAEGSNLIQGIVEGDVTVTDGATFFIGPNQTLGFDAPSLFLEGLNISGGGTFGGDGWIVIGNTQPAFTNLFNITDGWLYGGNEQGQGQLRITGQSFNSTFGPNAGLKITIDSDNFNTDSSYFTFDTLSFWNLTGSRMYVNLIGNSYISTERTFSVLQSLYLLPDGELYEGINAIARGNGTFSSLETSRVTRSIEIVDNFNEGFFGFSTSELLMNLNADYASPAGELGRMGETLNSLISAANADPDSWQAALLGYLDSMAGTTTSYQQALASTMPTTQFAAERATAETMFFDVQRQNLREIAIGSRGPGMVRTARAPQLLASLQEENAVEAGTASSNQPDIIINPSTGAVSTSSTDSDVFHALFVDGYGSWNDMREVAFTPGYTNDAWGVSAGWGIGLADGITVGLTAGFEENSITLKSSTQAGSGDAIMNSIRAAPFLSWSGVTGDTEQYVILTAGGAYNYGSGSRGLQIGGPANIDRSLEIHGWEFDIMGAVGTRVPLTQTLAFQPEASIRYSLLKNSGDETQANGGGTTDYTGGTFQYANSRLGVGLEWFGTPAFRTTARVGYQAQYYNWGTTTWDLGGATVSESPGSGTINQVFVGLQLEWVPSWNTTLNVGFNGAYGDSTQNSISGGLMFRF